MEALVHRQPTDTNSGHHGVTREALTDLLREFGQQEAGGRQGIKPGDLSTRDLNGDETVGDVPPNILGRVLLKILVEGELAARKGRAVMFSQRFDAKRERSLSAEQIPVVLCGGTLEGGRRGRGVQ